MPQQITITVTDEVYQGLQAVAGRRTVGELLEDIARPIPSESCLEASYRDMSLDAEREEAAAEWTEALTPDSVAGDAAR